MTVIINETPVCLSIKNDVSSFGNFARSYTVRSQQFYSHPFRRFIDSFSPTQIFNNDNISPGSFYSRRVFPSSSQQRGKVEIFVNPLRSAPSCARINTISEISRVKPVLTLAIRLISIINY